MSAPASDEDGAAAKKLEGSLLMLAVAVLWGSNFPAVKAIMESGLSPAAAAALRFSVAALALLPLLRGRPLPRDLVLGGLECGGWIALGYVAQALALHDAQAGVVAFIASLQVVFVPMVLTAFGRPTTPRLLAAAALCISGVAFLELGASADAATSLTAQLLAILQPVGFGTSYLRIEALMKRYPDSALQLSSLQLISNALVSLTWLGVQSLYSGQGIDLHALQSPAVLGGLAWTALMSTALTVLLQTRALSKLSATDSSVIVATEPLWAAVFASLLLGESLDSTEMLGGVLILAGCLSNAVLPEDFLRAPTLVDPQPPVEPTDEHEAIELDLIPQEGVLMQDNGTAVAARPARVAEKL